MCDGEGSLASVSQALAMLHRALDHLNAADVASLPSGVQAEALRALERAEAKHTSARGRVLAAFAAQGGYEDDGQGTARTWLKWQTRITTSAAAGAVGWARRLSAHPVIAGALAAGELSRSWARQLCEWTDQLPEAQRDDADEILAAAARGGAGLAALGGLAREMYERCQQDGAGDADDGFDDRYLRLGITFRGAGRAEGDLTPGCAAALSAVLEALGKKAGPEDVRTGAQRRHDALEEACRRLIRSGMLPGRAGQPTQMLVHMTLGQLRGITGTAAGIPGGAAGIPGASAAGDARAAARASQPGWVTGPEADAAACDATVVPLVTGHVDRAALDRLTDAFLATTASPPAEHGSRPPRAHTAAQSRDPRPAAPGAARPGRRRPVRPRRPRRPAPRRPPRPPTHHHQPAAGHRRRHRNHPRPPAPRRHHPPPALRLPRLRPARQHLRHPPPDPPSPRRPHRPAQPGPALQLPPPDRDPPVGLAAAAQQRWHHHRHQPRPHAYPAQPQPAAQPGRVTEDAGPYASAPAG